MKVKLYTKVKVREEKHDGPVDIPDAVKTIYDPVSNKTIALMPVEADEELLGEFNAIEQTTPNGKRWVIVITPRKRIRISAETLIKETDVNAFRVERIQERTGR